MNNLKKSPNWLLWGEIVLVLAVAIVPRVLTLGHTFVVNDETLYWDFSNQFTKALLSQNWQATMVGGNAYPSVTIMWVQVVGFALRWLWAWLTGSLDPQFYYQLALDRSLDFALLSQRRLPMALANAGIVLLIYFYVRQLLGRRVALVAVLLIGLDPFYLSDARTMRGDSLMAGFMALSVMSLLLAIHPPSSGAKQNWRQLIFSAIMAGLAFLTKMSALPVFIFGIILLIGRGLLQAWTIDGNVSLRLYRFWKAGLRLLLLWIAIIALICFIFWPALWVTPGQVFNTMRNFAADAADGGRTIYFLGHRTEAGDFLLFYPLTFFFRATPLTLMGLGGLLIAAINFIRRRRQGTTRLTFQMVNLGLLGAYALMYMGVMTIGLLKRSWYLLPFFPVAMILAAQGWLWLANQIRQRRDVAARSLMWSTVALTAIGILLIVQVMQAIPVHPYYYAYWNPMARGMFAPVRLEMLGWGLDTSLAAQWLNARPDYEQLKVAVRPSMRELRPMFKGEIIPFTAEQPWSQADFIVLRQRHLQLGEHSANQLEYLQRFSPVHTMTLNGVTFGWIYPGPAAQVALNSKLVGQATLLGYDLPELPLSVEHSSPLKLYWRNRGQTSNESLFARLVDSDGFVWVEAPVLPLPDYETASHTLDAIIEGQADLRPPVGVPPGLYFLKIGLKKNQSRQVIGEFELLSGKDQLTVAQTVSSPTLPALTHPEPHRFGDDLLLLGYNLPQPLSSAKNDVVDLYWQAQRKIQEDYVLVLRLLDQTEQEVWYHLARPARGIHSTPGWLAGEIVRDPWQIDALDKTPPGLYTLELEVYTEDKSVGKMTLGTVNIITLDESKQAAEVEAIFDKQVALLQYDLTANPGTTDSFDLTITLTWQPLISNQQLYHTQLVLLSATGQTLYKGEASLSFTEEQSQTDIYQFSLPSSEITQIEALQVQLFDAHKAIALPLAGGQSSFYLDDLMNRSRVTFDTTD